MNKSMFWDDNTNIKGFIFSYIHGKWVVLICWAQYIYGVFPMKGNLLNVQEISHKEIMENDEINNINCILGP